MSGEFGHRLQSPLGSLTCKPESLSVVWTPPPHPPFSIYGGLESLIFVHIRFTLLLQKAAILRSDSV